MLTWNLTLRGKLFLITSITAPDMFTFFCLLRLLLFAALPAPKSHFQLKKNGSCEAIFLNEVLESTRASYALHTRTHNNYSQ